MANHGPVVAVVTDGKEAFGQRLKFLLEPQGFEFCEVPPAQDILRGLRDARPQLAFIVSFTEGVRDGVSIISRVRACSPTLPLILAAARSSADHAIAAFRAGVTDYVNCACSDEELSLSIRRSLEQPRAMYWRCNSPAPQKDAVNQYLIGESDVMHRLKEYVRTAAFTDASVLITGETGTGKELVAQLIHSNSLRSEERLISVNCAALPEGLLESELFGFEKGSFTGANASYDGKLKLADGGTVFFDEIGDMSLVAQAKIIRAIESKQIFRLGGKREISLDFRVVAATNRNLEGMMASGRFREDLFYRLNVARIHVPPLRARKGDVPHLVQHFLEKLNPAFGAHVVGVEDRAMQRLINYYWPGNVRELRNILESALIKGPSNLIRLSHLPESFGHLNTESEEVSSGDEQEKEAVLAALNSSNWNKSKAANRLNWSRMTLYRKMKKYRITGTPPKKPQVNNSSH